MRRSICLWPISKHSMRITGVPSSAQLLWYSQIVSLTVQLCLACSRNQLNFFTNSHTDPSNQIFIFFSDEKSVGVKTMRKFVYSPYTLTCRQQFPILNLFPLRLLNILEEKNISKGIIIFPGTMTSSARKVRFPFPWIDLLICPCRSLVIAGHIRDAGKV
jgi:RNA polymerase Rpb5, N-terminal domain